MHVLKREKNSVVSGAAGTRQRTPLKGGVVETGVVVVVVVLRVWSP